MFIMKESSFWFNIRKAGKSFLNWFQPIIQLYLGDWLLFLSVLLLGISIEYLPNQLHSR